jgi:anti-sigma B factor antagonist
VSLRVTTRAMDGVYIVHCEGRIVFGDEGAALHERLRQLLTGTPNIILNLGRVEHIDSGGIGILVGLFVSAKNQGGELKLVSPNKHVQEVLHRTELDTVFKIYATAEEAAAAFRKRVA